MYTLCQQAITKVALNVKCLLVVLIRNTDDALLNIVSVNISKLYKFLSLNSYLFQLGYIIKQSETAATNKSDSRLWLV